MNTIKKSELQTGTQKNILYQINKYTQISVKSTDKVTWETLGRIKVLSVNHISQVYFNYENEGENVVYLPSIGE